ncbi:WG repeat-containing protein [Psychrobacter sp. DAB_AL43B]|uniref:WG repeat-containing protein n=1 Tax=Psychrobacter sp. DAB_AL43B TaxID=1028416 RepID=UPI0011AB3DA0|nr:WG repeat-containing protein [Psychrobacter sp. DAB_AL43B]
MYKQIAKVLLVPIIASVSGLSALAAEDCIPPKSNYSNIQCTDDAQLFVAYDDDYRPQALLNKQGKVTASLKAFDKVQAWLYSDGFMPVLKNDKVGYINAQGKLVVPTIYDNLIGPDDKYNEVWANPVYQGKIVVGKDGAYGVIDTSNKVILSFENNYVMIDPFSNDRAPVYDFNTELWGLIDTNGKEVVAPQYDGLDGHLGGHYGFHEGLLGVIKDDKWGFVTKTGAVAVPFIYDEIRPFSEQLAGVRKGKSWGFIDGANRTVIPFKFSDDKVQRMSVTSFGATYFNFNNGTAQIEEKNDGTSVCINKLGKIVACSEW